MICHQINFFPACGHLSLTFLLSQGEVGFLPHNFVSVINLGMKCNPGINISFTSDNFFRAATTLVAGNWLLHCTIGNYKEDNQKRANFFNFLVEPPS